SLNYATYFADDRGRIACCGLDYADSYWFDDGYGDHVRHYLWAMGAVPEFAPAGENHLLRSSSVVTRVAYAKSGVEYSTFDPQAVEVLRLKSRPARVGVGTGDAPLAVVDGADLVGGKPDGREGYAVTALPG